MMLMMKFLSSSVNIVIISNFFFFFISFHLPFFFISKFMLHGNINTFVIVCLNNKKNGMGSVKAMKAKSFSSMAMEKLQ